MQTSPRTALQDPRIPDPKQLTQPSDKLPLLAAAALAAFYFATSVYIASHRLFWFDEFFTVRIGQLPTWTMIWTALSHAADSLPPFYYMLVRAFGTLFGRSELVARLPSALAMVAGLLLTFDCARRLTDGLHGLIALSGLTCSFLPYYGYEARSYAIYFMFAALAFWVWTRTASNLRAATFFGAALLLGVTMHYYAVMCLAPYALWEVLRWRRGQRPSAKLIAGVVGVAIPAALLSPLIVSFSRKFSSGFWNRPSLAELRAIFPQLFPDALLLLALIAVWIVLSSLDEKDNVVQPMEADEAIGWLFLTVPLIGFVLAELGTNAFFSRYFICVLPGVAVAFACLLWRNFRKNHRVATGIFFLLAGWGMWKQVAVVQHPETVEATGIREFLSLESSLRAEGKHYMVFSPPLVFSEAQYYSSHPGDCILLLPPGFEQPSDALQSSPDPYLHQRLLLNLSQYYPMQFWRLYNLKAYASEVALIEPSQDVLDALQRSGLQVQVRSAAPLRVVYLR
jgi:Dolichyl-phosphate-mannose-protein mannosyltransferase